MRSPAGSVLPGLRTVTPPAGVGVFASIPAALKPAEFITQP